MQHLVLLIFDFLQKGHQFNSFVFLKIVFKNMIVILNSYTKQEFSSLLVEFLSPIIRVKFLKREQLYA